MNPAYAVSAVSLVALTTLVVGAVGLRLSRTTSDFYVASRVVSPGWNASAICGEYLSAASFLGVAGLVYTNGVDMLWYPVGYTVGYVVLLVLVAAPLRRSGAYTLPDFAEARLESRAVRLMASLLVVAIGWLYLLPQFQGAGLTLATVAGAPPWVGRTVVAAIVLAAVGAGGMRSVTIVQAVQYWIKLTAISVPAFVLLWVWARGGPPAPWASGGAALADWSRPLVDHGTRQHATYATYSTLLALCLGTMGLPHVLVRFYTNPDGRAARRTTVTVVALLGAFYVFTPVYGVLGRIYLPNLGDGVRADSVTLLLPQAVVPGGLGDVLGAVLAGGAFAAFLSTASGLTVSVTGVIDQDLIDPLLSRHIGGDSTRIQQFRIASVVAVAVPYVVSSVTPAVPLADIVGLAFAVAASTFCPLLVLGVWWPRLSVPGAAAGMLCGGVLASAAAVATMVGVGGTGWFGALLAQPAAWTIPTAFTVSVLVSLATPSRVPAGALRTMVRLHAPEALTGAAEPVA